MVEAGGRYSNGWWNVDTPNGLNNTETCMKYLACAHHEAINKRIKQFFMLTSVFRHALEKRQFCFHAAANIIQMIIEYEEPPFQVQYHDG